MAKRRPRPTPPIVVDAKEAARAASAIDASHLLRDGTKREDFEAAVLGSAVSFSVVQIRNVPGIEEQPRRPLGACLRREDRATLVEACMVAGAWGVVDTMIYAINAQGRSVLVLAGGKRVQS